MGLDIICATYVINIKQIFPHVEFYVTSTILLPSLKCQVMMKDGNECCISWYPVLPIKQFLTESKYFWHTSVHLRGRCVEEILAMIMIMIIIIMMEKKTNIKHNIVDVSSQRCSLSTYILMANNGVINPNVLWMWVNLQTISDQDIRSALSHTFYWTIIQERWQFISITTSCALLSLISGMQYYSINEVAR